MYYARLTKEFAKYDPSKTPHDLGFSSRNHDEPKSFRRFSEPMTTARMNSAIQRAERLTGTKLLSSRIGSKSRSGRHHSTDRSYRSPVTALKRQSRGLNPLALKHQVILEENYSPMKSAVTRPLPKYTVPQSTVYTGGQSAIERLSRASTKRHKSSVYRQPVYSYGDHTVAKEKLWKRKDKVWNNSDAKAAKLSTPKEASSGVLGFSLSTSGRESLKSVQQQLKDSKKEYVELDTSHKSLKNKYDEAISEAVRNKEKYRETKQKLSEITARLQSERTLLGRMHDEFTRLHDKHVTLHTKHDSSKKDHKKLQKETNGQRYELLRSKQEQEAMQTDLKSTRAKNKELREKIKKASVDSEGTKSKINKAMDIIRKMKDELARYRRKHRELKAKYQVIKEKYEVAQMHHKDLAIVKQDVRRELEKEFRREIETLKRTHQLEIQKLEGQLSADRSFAANLVRSKDSYITRLQEHNRLLQQHLKLIKQALENRLLVLEEESRAMSRDIVRIRNSMNEPGAMAPPVAVRGRTETALRQAETWINSRFTTQCSQIKHQIDTISDIVESGEFSTMRTDATSVAGTVRSTIQPGAAENRETPKPALMRRITPRRAPTPTPNNPLAGAVGKRYGGPGSAPGAAGMAGVQRPW